MKKQIELMVLWEKTDKNGDKYFSGKLNGNSILVFKNKYKQDEKHPDYKVYLVEKEREQKPIAEDDSDTIPF
jgi:hypothetical protein